MSDLRLGMSCEKMIQTLINGLVSAGYNPKSITSPLFQELDKGYYYDGAIYSHLKSELAEDFELHLVVNDSAYQYSQADTRIGKLPFKF